MQRSIRLCLLTAFALFAASCSDAGDAFSPAPTVPSLSASNGSGSTAASSDEDVLPGDLDALAQFNQSALTAGAKRASAVIGPLGGSVRLGDFEVVVPAGAVDRNTTFSIRTFPESNGRMHALASFLPHATFNVPVTVRVPLNGTDAEGDVTAAVLWWNGQTWVTMPSTLTNDGRVEAQTTHFSLYGTSRRGFTLAGG
jgi:hypothetical protein